MTWKNPYQTEEERAVILKQLMEETQEEWEKYALQSILACDKEGTIYVSSDGTLQLVKHKVRFEG